MYNHQLDTFIQAADAGSFSKAAEALFISSTAVMKQINLLEGNLGVQLFHRTPRGLTLTNAGKSYYQDAKYMIQYARDAQVRAKNAMQDNASVIRIGTSLMTPSQFLLDLWPQVHEVHSELKFQMVNFDNTPENAREILANLGQNIDIVAGIFDETMLGLRGCTALELMRVPICCAVSIYHPLAQKKILLLADLSGRRFMLMKRNWSKYVDKLRDDLWENYPEIEIVDFSFYNLEVFNQCEHENALLMAVPQWEGVHPLLKILPVEWNHSIPFGLLHSPSPSPAVRKLIQTVAQVMSTRIQPEG
ncbi:MAG: LysR family transcriptional regulator [Oscillibacter sp.]|nr:LysR family transcriptional regulator [Oscillibacter sp.]